MLDICCTCLHKRLTNNSEVRSVCDYIVNDQNMLTLNQVSLICDNFNGALKYHCAFGRRKPLKLRS